MCDVEPVTTMKVAVKELTPSLVASNEQMLQGTLTLSMTKVVAVATLSSLALRMVDWDIHGAFTPRKKLQLTRLSPLPHFASVMPFQWIHTPHTARKVSENASQRSSASLTYGQSGSCGP